MERTKRKLIIQLTSIAFDHTVIGNFSNLHNLLFKLINLKRMKQKQMLKKIGIVGSPDFMGDK